MMKNNIPPYIWKQGPTPDDGKSYMTYQSPLGYSYYREDTQVHVWASGEREATLMVSDCHLVCLTRNELLQLKLGIEKVYKEIDV